MLDVTIVELFPKLVKELPELFVEAYHVYAIPFPVDEFVSVKLVVPDPPQIVADEEITLPPTGGSSGLVTIIVWDVVSLQPFAFEAINITVYDAGPE